MASEEPNEELPTEEEEEEEEESEIELGDEDTDEEDEEEEGDSDGDEQQADDPGPLSDNGHEEVRPYADQSSFKLF